MRFFKLKFISRIRMMEICSCWIWNEIWETV